MRLRDDYEDVYRQIPSCDYCGSDRHPSSECPDAEEMALETSGRDEDDEDGE